MKCETVLHVCLSLSLLFSLNLSLSIKKIKKIKAHQEQWIYCAALNPNNSLGGCKDIIIQEERKCKGSIT